MDRWLALLAERGIDPQAIVPAALVLPRPERGLMLADLGGQLLAAILSAPMISTLRAISKRRLRMRLPMRSLRVSSLPIFLSKKLLAKLSAWHKAKAHLDLIPMPIFAAC